MSLILTDEEIKHIFELDDIPYLNLTEYKMVVQAQIAKLASMDDGKLREILEKLLEHQETWWLIERKPYSTEPEGNKFFTGDKWSNSALDACRFKTKDEAQFIIDEIYGESNAFIMRGPFPVEHMWANFPPPIVDQILPLISARVGQAKIDARKEIVEKLLSNQDFAQIDIPDEVFQSAEAKRCGFTKRSFLEAGWRKLSQLEGEKNGA